MSERHLMLLREMLALISRYAASVRAQDLAADRETWLKVKGALEVAAQCTVDLALAVVAKRSLGVPQTYREAFALLAHAGVIDDALAAHLEQWAGLRNVLVHVYTALDLDRLQRALSETAPLAAFHAIAARELAAP